MAQIREVRSARQGYLERVKDNPSSHDCTIQIMGRVGEGKSAFLNTYCAAVYGRWTRIAQEAAHNRDETSHLNHYFHQRQKAEAIEGAKVLSSSGKLAEYHLPSFRDFSGLDNMNGPVDRLLIAALLFNTLEPGTSRAAFASSWLLRQTQKLKIAEAVRCPMATDRVFIVWSARNSLPENFLKAFRDVWNMVNGSDNAESALLFRRVFVIITNVDAVGTERIAFMQKKHRLKEILGLRESNILEVENYNKGTDVPGIVTYREQRDLKVISFMDKVMNPAGGPLTRAQPTWILNAWRSVRIAKELFGKDAGTFWMILTMVVVAVLACICTCFYPLVTTLVVVSAFVLRQQLRGNTAVSSTPRKITFEFVERLRNLAEIFSRSFFIRIVLLVPCITGWFLLMLHAYTRSTIFIALIVVLRNPLFCLIKTLTRQDRNIVEQRNQTSATEIIPVRAD